MKIDEIIKKLNLKPINDVNNTEVSGAYVSYLLSDVMGRAKEGQIWITLQTHINVVAIASLKELSAIIIVNGL